MDVCNEGDDGLRAMRERAHDLVLLDRMLSRLNGIDVLCIARSEGVTTPVLMVTALGESGDLVEGLDHGADDYILCGYCRSRGRALGGRRLQHLPGP